MESDFTGLAGVPVTQAASTDKPLSMEDIQGGYAQMLRRDYMDWQNRFMPFEDMYRGLVMDKAENGKLRDAALGYVDQASAGAAGSLQAGLLANDRRFGVGLSADEQAGRNRMLLNASVAQQTGARNRMRGYLDDRDLRMLNGGLA